MATRKPRKKRAVGGATLDEDIVAIPQEEAEPEESNVRINAETGSVEIDNEDGSITIDPTGSTLWKRPEDDEDTSHDENLAEKIEPLILARIGDQLLIDIESDKKGRSQWEQMRAKCIELLGMKLEDPKGDVSRSSLGMSTSVVRDPTLLTAVNFFRANAYGELCPSGGPVKVVNFDTTETMQDNGLAEALQTDLNYYLTTTASEYYPDMYYMLWWTGLASGTFKKVYKCPLRRRPVSEYVHGDKMIVPTTATDLKNAGRVTHQIEMRRSVMRRMQILGVYRDVALTDPLPTALNAVDQKKASIEGKDPSPQRPEDQDYTVYECYCELDIPGFEHEIDGDASGLPLPYRVTIDETSREILEIRRNWDEDDEDQQAQIPFVLFPFSTGLSRIYGSGLGHEMGNIASALTALLRISIDGGILGNYPGFVKAKGAARDLTNEIMVPPGGCVEIDTAGMPIQQVMMPVPYKDASPAVMQLIEQLRGVAKQLGGTANMPVDEGKQNAPVGTTLALIEQATKPLSATHKMLHAAQSEEFRLLVRLFKDDPEALWRGNRRPAMGNDKAARLEKFKAALDNCNITPMADPNVPSEMHRKLIAMGLKQLTAGNPAYNAVEVDRFCTKVMFKMADNDFNKLLAPAQQGPPDPAVLLAQIEAEKTKVAQSKVQLDAQKLEWQKQEALAERDSKREIEATKLAIGMDGKKGVAAPAADPFKSAEIGLQQRAQDLNEAKMWIEAQNKKADREAKLAVEAMKIANTIGIHPEADGQVDEQLNQMSALITPASKGGMSLGGPVEAEPEPETPEMKSVRLALDIANALHERRQSGYTH